MKLMKNQLMNSQKMLVGLLVAFTITSCTNSENQVATGKIGFTVSAEKHDAGGRNEDSETPSKLIISIEDEHGELFLGHQSLPLTSVGVGYATESIELPVGNYYVTEFIVTNDDGEALFIAPQTGSEKAPFTSTPLPLLFSVFPDGFSTVPVDALEVQEGDDPSDFGLTEFAMILSNQVNFNLFVENSGSALASTVQIEGIIDGSALYTINIDVPESGKPITLFDNVDQVMFSSTTTTAVQVLTIDELKAVDQFTFEINQ